MDITTAVKMNIYQTIVDQCRAPDVNEVSQSMKLPISDVQQAFESLAEQRLLVLEPADKRRIRMAPPFSGIKTPMQVQVADKTHYANCCWDALGVAAALHQDADIFTSCAYSGQALAIQVRDGRVQPVDCLATLPSRPHCGGKISSTLDGPCCSSGRRKMSLPGAANRDYQ